MEAFALKWFILYYFFLSALFSIQGFIWMFSPTSISTSTRDSLDDEKAPAKAIRPLRYLFLFTVVSLILSFSPFSWVNLVYTIWIFSMMFIFGRILVNWESFRTFWKANPAGLERFFQRTGALFLMMGLATFAVLYFTI
ncbi:hypothetical protein EP331_04205 [bacterium]|nr:MAG: hypothetical protein EP331_04205 [bacterium]